MYNIKTFQGPIAFGPAGQAGWVAGNPGKTVTVQGKDQTSSTIDAVLQVDRETAYPTKFTFDVFRGPPVDGRSQWQISVTQSITYSLTGKAAELKKGESILLGGVEDLGLTGGESWTIELWVLVNEIKSDTDQTVFGGDKTGSQSCLHCVFRNGGRLHLDF